MSRLSKLLGKKKEYDIGGEVIELSPLGIECLDLFLGLEKEETRIENLKIIMTKTLKTAVPDATEEELNQISVSHFKTLLEAILDVNGMGKEAIDVDKKPVPKA